MGNYETKPTDIEGAALQHLADSLKDRFANLGKRALTPVAAFAFEAQKISISKINKIEKRNEK